MKTSQKPAELFTLAPTPQQHIQKKDPIRLFMVLGLAILSLSGCVQQYRIMTDWYSPPKIARLPDLGPLAVYLFTDNRAEKDTQVGLSGFERFSATGIASRANVVYVSEPVARTVTQAFTDGLRERGFPVIDRTKTPLDTRTPLSQGVVGLSGKILALHYEQFRPFLDDLHSMARGRIVLEAYDPGSGRKFWEKEYTRTITLGPRMPEREPRNKSPLGQVLAEVVVDAVYDPEFILAVGRKRNLEK